jgi:hypothetical protein
MSSQKGNDFVQDRSERLSNRSFVTPSLKGGLTIMKKKPQPQSQSQSQSGSSSEDSNEHVFKMPDAIVKPKTLSSFGVSGDRQDQKRIKLDSTADEDGDKNVDESSDSFSGWGNDDRAGLSQYSKNRREAGFKQQIRQRGQGSETPGAFSKPDDIRKDILSSKNRQMRGISNSSVRSSSSYPSQSNGSAAANEVEPSAVVYKVRGSGSSTESSSSSTLVSSMTGQHSQWDAPTPLRQNAAGAEADESVSGAPTADYENEQLRLDRDWYNQEESGAFDDVHNPFAEFDAYYQQKEEEAAKQQVVQYFKSICLNLNLLF